MERFKDTNKWLASFANTIDVKCPKCELKAVVKRAFESEKEYNDTRILECKNCFFSQKGQQMRYIAIVDTYCCNNTDKIEFRSQYLNQKPETIQLKCTICMQQKEYKPKIEEVAFCFSSDENKQRERWFNCELWYQKQFDTSVFWAYNGEHIEYLEHYIKATLRERNNSGSSSGSLVSRLPQFVKVAKNREKLLKIIKKWQQK